MPYIPSRSDHSEPADPAPRRHGSLPLRILRAGGSVLAVLSLLASGLPALLSRPAEAAMARLVQVEVKSQSIADVVDVLSDLSGLTTLKVGDMRGRLENWQVEGEGVAVFQSLGRAANLFIAYDGARVIVAPKAEARTAILPPTGQDWATVQSVAQSLFPVMPDDALTYDRKAGVMSIRGPAVFNETILAVLARPQTSTVRVIRSGRIQDLDPRMGR